ncbi:DUF2637 domain-containing protein [Marinitenerispora sediminis]|nr:DUF2637 domain-containing protein [Marinitenerispora sediminis]
MAPHTSPKSPGPRPAPRKPETGSRIVAISLTGLGVLVIAACAVLLSYNGIYQIALQGNVDENAAHLFPGVFTLLLLMAFWTTYLLRDAPRRRRIWVDLLIVALIALSAGASTLHALGYRLVEAVAVVAVAVAPWAALLVAFRIWLWVIVHLRGERSGRSHAAARGRSRRTGPSGPGEDPRPAERAEEAGAAEPTRPDAARAPEPDPAPAPGDARPLSPDPVRPALEPAAEPAAEDSGASGEPALFRPAAAAPGRPAPAAGPATDSAEPPSSPAAGPAAAPSDDPGGEAGATAEGGGLPRRVPSGPDNPIKRAALVEPETSAAEAPGSAPSPDPAAAPSAADVPTEPQRSFALPRKRPMVSKPRHTRTAGAVPPEPPSWRVRSEPLPPRD